MLVLKVDMKSIGRAAPAELYRIVDTLIFDSAMLPSSPLAIQFSAINLEECATWGFADI